MKYYYCKFIKDWSDEFNYKEHFLLTEEEKFDLEKQAEETQEKFFNYYFGTNEGWEDINLKELVDSIDFNEIDEHTYNVLNKIVSSGTPFDYEVEEEEEYDYNEEYEND